jgi:hypothetical protein
MLYAQTLVEDFILVTWLPWDCHVLCIHKYARKHRQTDKNYREKIL